VAERDWRKIMWSCSRRTRYNTATCRGQRMDADAIEAAVIGALADFYRHQHVLIADAIIKADVGLTPQANIRCQRVTLALIFHVCKASCQVMWS
jgi:hypothetical protein